MHGGSDGGSQVGWAEGEVSETLSFREGVLLLNFANTYKGREACVIIILPPLISLVTSTIYAQIFPGIHCQNNPNPFNCVAS